MKSVSEADKSCMLQSLSAIENCIRVNIKSNNNTEKQLAASNNDCGFSVISSPTSSNFNLASSGNEKKICKEKGGDIFKNIYEPDILSLKKASNKGFSSKLSAGKLGKRSKENKLEFRNDQTKSKGLAELIQTLNRENQKKNITASLDSQLLRPCKNTSVQNNMSINDILDLCEAAVTMQNYKNKLNRDHPAEGKTSNKVGDANDVLENEMCLNSGNSAHTQVYPTSRAIKDEMKQRDQCSLNTSTTDSVVSDRCFKRTETSHFKTNSDVLPKSETNMKIRSESRKKDRNSKELTVDDLKINSVKELRYLLETYYNKYEENKNCSNVSSETDIPCVVLNERKRRSKSLMRKDKVSSNHLRDQRCSTRIIESRK